METTLWELCKDGRQAKCTVRPRANDFELALVYEGLRMGTHVCHRQEDVRRWASEERSTWQLHGWLPLS